MKRKEPGGEASPAANDNRPAGSTAPAEPLDPRIRCIAQAIGRYMAREQMKAWRGGQRQAANDNQPHHRDP